MSLVVISLACYCVLVKLPIINLTDSQLGAKLLQDARGKLPLLVWYNYVAKHAGGSIPITISVAEWSGLSDPDSTPLHPVRAMQIAKLLIKETMQHLITGSPRLALDPAERAHWALIRGLSWRKRKPGQPATMRPTAVRAYIIRKFNPSIKWGKLADLLFLEKGKCPRTIFDVAGAKTCRATRHHYNSPCVKALRTAVNNLHSAMKHDRIPF